MKDITVKPNISIRKAMKELSKYGEKCLVIIDEKKKILGTLSDGDLRRAILNGAAMRDSIIGIYQQKPTLLIEGKYTIPEAKRLFTKNKFDLIPVVDKKGILKDILQWENVFEKCKSSKKENLDVPVVIMAGGKGNRLKPFTNVLPKSLVPIHEKPIIEHIIDRFTEVGVNHFFITVNYKAGILKAYFEELKPNYLVDFVEEHKPLGTAGSLKFLEKRFKKPFMVTNCDIIIKTDFPDLYEFHQNNNYDITLVASMKNYTIPYGTCQLNSEGFLKNIYEKPKYDFLINTGLYVLNPDMLELIPTNKLYHITNLIKDAQKSGKKVGVYPIDDDNWIDVGQWAEYKKAINTL